MFFTSKFSTISDVEFIDFCVDVLEIRKRKLQKYINFDVSVLHKNQISTGMSIEQHIFALI